jgi:hypothetical protein
VDVVAVRVKLRIRSRYGGSEAETSALVNSGLRGLIRRNSSSPGRSLQGSGSGLRLPRLSL